ncbi:LysM peptidoglycan-binding domain-containing protein [Longibacter salinarum]|nr:lytic transglycosylase domain-containing protein [Longibacter salinarum]
MQGSLRLTVLAVLTTFLLAGCSSTESLSDSNEDAPTNSEAVAEADTLSEQKTPINEQVRRLFVLEARILAAPDSTAADSLHTGRLLNQAMGELSALLDRDPSVIERDAVRDVYRGLTKEYRRYHRYEGSADSMETAKGDIFSVRAGLFASLEQVDEPLLEDVMAPEAIQNIETEIPLTMNRLVKQSLDYLKSDPSKHVDSWLQREQTYGPMIDHILAQEGVPHELRYLAMIESGLNPRARSWAGAVGMWQFMRGTGRMYDLKVDGWIDERRDPEKATRAAARHLSDLYDSLGDWHLVLAAYNCGEGCVRRAVRRTERYDDIEDPNYWEVYDRLPRETRGYVPMFIAATILASQPEKHNIEPPKAAPAYAYDYVAVHGSMLTVYEIARLAETDADVIRALNPELRQRTLPPSREKYYIRIPVGSYPTFAWGYADLPESKKRPATSYRVRSGDTLSEIADRFGTSTNRLRRTNGIRGSMINIGQTLVVPVRNYDSAIQNASPQQPMRVQYGAVTPVRPLDRIVITDRGLQRSPAEQQSPPVRTASTRSSEQTSSSSASSSSTSETVSTKAKSSSSEATASTESSSSTSESSSSASQKASSSSSSASIVTVRRGDTLSDIAARHGVSTRNLQRWNRLGSSRIHPGQTLRLTAPPAGTSTYTVRRGDSLDRIARTHGVTIRQLRDWNDLRGSRIYPGQTLEIRDGGGDRPIIYTVQRGDTLSTIAKSYGTSVGELRMINELRGSRIYPGQKLKIETN